MDQKARIIFQITKTKIDEATIFVRTQETLREHISMLLQNESLNKKTNLSMIYAQLPGLYTTRQLSQLSTLSKQNIEVAIDQDLVSNSDAAKNYLYTEISTLVKLIW